MILKGDQLNNVSKMRADPVICKTFLVRGQPAVLEFSLDAEAVRLVGLHVGIAEVQQAVAPTALPREPVEHVEHGAPPVVSHTWGSDGDLAHIPDVERLPYRLGQFRDPGFKRAEQFAVGLSPSGI